MTSFGISKITKGIAEVIAIEEPIQVISSVDPGKLDSYWCDFEGTKVTLGEMIKGYLDHLHLHMREIHQLIEA